MTLTEFLAARLGEKEQYAKDLLTNPALRDISGMLGLSDQMLREVEAGRKILAEHAPGYPVTYPEPSGQPTCGKCHAGGWDWDPEEWPCTTVRTLAAVWCDHPDYDET